MVVNSSTLNCYINEINPIIVFIVHGFMGDSNADWVISIKDNILEYYSQYNTRVNVITVDWSELAAAIQDWKDFINNPIYIKAATNTKDYVAPALRLLVSTFPSKFVTCIGFSLGAQVCGAFGRLMNEIGSPIDIIHGLDPAGPLFDQGLFNLVNLNKNDALFVSAIHTDSYLYSVLSETSEDRKLKSCWIPAGLISFGTKVEKYYLKYKIYQKAL